MEFRIMVKVLMRVIWVLCGSWCSGYGYIRHAGGLHYAHPTGQIHTLAWAVRINDAETDDARFTPSLVATQLGLIDLGAVAALGNYFIFVHPMYHNLSAMYSRVEAERMFDQMKKETERRLDLHPGVTWYKQEVMRRRTKREVAFKDPFYSQQWHLVSYDNSIIEYVSGKMAEVTLFELSMRDQKLQRFNFSHNERRNGFDLNVSGLWARNITGKGVTVSVVDDGLEWTNKDLINNYKQIGSWDLNDNDMDPMPSRDGAKNEHGTRCAGEIAAARNDFCGIGVAYEAGISGIKVLDGKMTDSLEATAFHMKMEVNDIYSCSWGPEDDGQTIDGPHHLTSMAMEYGVEYGRKGYGSIYVVASGNGGVTDDNCNFDGYANSIYTATIGAVDEYGYAPYYAEECAAMLAVALSSGGSGDRNIVTTDWTAVDGTGCTTKHTGTSAAAPLAAAIIALMLQVKPCLTWRDVQYLIVFTAHQVDAEFPDWYKNAAGLFHSHHHGFGLLNAWKMVSAAKTWTSVPWMSTYSSGTLFVNEIVNIHSNHTYLTYNLTEEAIRPFFIWIMEYVRVKISVSHPKRGQLELRLRAPSGTESVLSKPRKNDKSTEGFNDWVFATVRFWGEKPVGQWTLILTDHDAGRAAKGLVKKWELIITGTPITASDFQSRVRLAGEAAEKNVLDDGNDTVACRPPSQRFTDDVVALSDRILQILCLFGGFLFLLAVFETLEYIFCYDEEKKKFYAEMLKGEKRRNELTPLISEDATCLQMDSFDKCESDHHQIMQHIDDPPYNSNAIVNDCTKHEQSSA